MRTQVSGTVFSRVNSLSDDIEFTPRGSLANRYPKEDQSIDLYWAAWSDYQPGEDEGRSFASVSTQALRNRFRR